MPKLSVLLPVHGREPSLERTLCSLAAQRFSDFEVVVVTDDVAASVRRTLDAPPLDVVELDGPGEGVAAARSHGLEHCRGEYVAFIDGDDVAKPGRFDRQVATLDRRPEVGVVGSAYEAIDAEGRVRGVHRPPRRHETICWRLFTTGWALPNPTTMVRRATLADAGVDYDSTYAAAEDYDLWTRLIGETEFRNLREPLTQYRTEGPRVSTEMRAAKRDATVRIAHRTVGRHLPSVSLTEAAVREVLDLLHFGERQVDVERAATNYLGMLRAFEAEVRGDRLGPVRSTAAKSLAEGIAGRPVGADSVGVLVGLLGVSPTYPLSLARDALRSRLETGLASVGA
jgi:hypothetical protein